MNRTDIDWMYASVRMVFGDDWRTFEPNKLLNVPNRPVTVYFTTALLNHAHLFHQAIRFVTISEHTSQTIIAFLHAARLGLRVTRDEDARAYATHAIRIRQDMGESLGRNTYVSTRVAR